VCDAFQNGIPDQIAQGFNTHRMPFPGDGGIQFEAIEQSNLIATD
jgi:hypothetical protein